MVSRLFFFGRTPDLSFAEIMSFTKEFVRLAPDIVRVAGPFPVDGNQVSDTVCISVLGGTVKIAEERQQGKGFTSEELATLLLSENHSETLTFGLSGYGVSSAILRELSVDVKKLLSTRLKHVRFILPKEGNVVSSVAIVKENVTELVIVKTGETYIIGKTTAVQPFEAWNLRDYARPHIDPKAGMLPPKIARMVVNIALVSDSRGKTLFDPFCGMGTICAEAMMRGVNVVGCDIDKNTVAKAKKNMAWLARTYKLAPTSRLFVGDATHSDEYIDHGTIDAIVSEPYLGTSQLGEGKITNPAEIRDIVRGLEKLYIGSFKSWRSVLKPNGVVVVALPSFTVGKTVYSVKKVIDTCENYGYTKVLGPIAYKRPQAIVQRNFYLLKLF